MMAVFSKERPDYSGRLSAPALAGSSGTVCTADACPENNVEVDVAEIYFLIMHFLSGGPCHRAFVQLSNEVWQHKLLPRRYQALPSKGGKQAVDDDDDGLSSPLSYANILARHPTVRQDHLVRLLQQLLVHNRASVEALERPNSRIPTGADVPTLLGNGSFSLFDSERRKACKDVPGWIRQLRWPHWHADQVHGLMFRELGGGYARHKQAPSVRTPSYVIVKPAILVDRIQIIKKLRGHRNAVYCAIFDGTGRYVITGSDDRLVKFWSAETGLCLRSCRGHEGDITDLAVSNRNKYVASASNDFSIRVWLLPSGVPVSVLRGHTASVTAIAFSPRQGCEHLLLSSSDDGTCRIWDASDSSLHSRVYMPNPKDINPAPKPTGPAPPATVPGCNQILCCAFNADGSIFVTGSSDKIARVWDACKWNDDVTGRPNYEMDTLKGHENDVNYVQFSGCAAPRKPLSGDNVKEEHATRFRNSWFSHDSIVTCSRDGTAIIWVPHFSKSYVKVGRWQKAYHLRVPPPPMPPQPPRGNGPRQRLLPTPRGVNMIVWSLDNRFVLAAIMDHRICVWNASDGSLVHSLTGHDKPTFVLDVHPINPRIAMSAGYDGRVIIWDIWEGHPIKVYETEEFNLVDGNFSPDGTSLVVSDEVGQIYIFGTGSKMSEKDVKYDQFFLGDFRPLVRDLHGNVLDVETQQPPHLRNLRDLLCDAGMIPYAEPYQSIYQQRRLANLGLEWQPPTQMLNIGTSDDVTYFPAEQPMAFQPPAAPSPERQDRQGPASGDRNRWVEQPPEVEEAMDWEQDVAVLSEDTGSDYSASEESLSDEKEGEGYASLSEGETNSEEQGIEATVHLRRSGRNKRKKLESGRASSGRRVRGRTSSDYDTRKRRQQRGRHSKVSRNDAYRASRVNIVSDQDHTSTRPQRQAARNALNLFTTFHGPAHDEDEDDKTDHEDRMATERINVGEEEEGPSSIGTGEVRTQSRSIRRNVREAVEENEQRHHKNHASSSQPEIDNLGDCRRPRSQRPRKIVIKFKNPAGPSNSSTQSDGLREKEGDSVHPSEPAGRSDCKVVSPTPDLESLQATEMQKFHRKLIIKPPKPIGQGSGSTSKVLERCSDEEGDAVGRSGASLPSSTRESPTFSPRMTQSGPEVKSEEEKQWHWKKGKAIKGGQGSGSSKHAEVGCYNGSLEFNESTVASNERLDPHVFKQSQLLGNLRSADDNTCSAGNGAQHSECEGGQLDTNDLSERRADERFSRSWYQSMNNIAQKVDLNKEPDPEEQVKETEWHETNGSYQTLEGSFSAKSPIPSKAGGDHRTSGVQSSTKYAMEDKYSSQELPTSSREAEGGDFADDVHEDQEVKQHMQDLKHHVLQAGCRDQRSHGKSVDEDFNIARKRILDNEQLINASVSSEDHEPQAEKMVEVADGAISDREGDFRRNHELYDDENADGYDTGQEHLEASLEREGAEVHTDQDDYADEEESESKEYEASPPSNYPRGQSGRHSTDVGKRSTERKRHKPLSELASSGYGHSQHSDVLLSPARRATRHARTVVENRGRAQAWSLGHHGAEELAGPSRSVPHTDLQSRGKGKRQKSHKLHDMAWENRTPNSRSLHTRQGSHSDASRSGSTRDRSLKIKLKCTENTTRTEAVVSEGNADERWKQTRASVRGTQRQNHIQKEKAKVVEVKVGMAHSTPRGGWRTPRYSSRQIESAKWLLMSEVEQGTHYTPQYGDEVAYLQQGHNEFLEKSDSKEKGPWMRHELRSVEFCRITDLNYHVERGLGSTICELELELIDATSSSCGITFRLTLPELIGHPDFIVEKSRYDASVARGWAARDHCKVWWGDDGEGEDGNGQWWDGRIKAIKAKSDEFPDSPWDRCLVIYSSSPEPTRHSPWELFDKNCRIPGWIVPQIEHDIKRDLLQAIIDVTSEATDTYGVKELQKLTRNQNFVNEIPVPLTLKNIQERVLKNYYRSRDAVEHDIHLLVANAEVFHGADSGLAKKMSLLASVLLETLQ